MNLNLGVLCSVPSEQLKDTGIPRKTLNRFDLIEYAINILYIQGYMPQSAVDKARKKLIKEIKREYGKFCGVAKAQEEGEQC
jgi:hypothetical protein